MTGDDEARSVGSRFALLWDQPTSSRQGRPAKVSRTEVVDAAVGLADADGMGAVSMRAVAKALGVGTMTLYTHVASREELVDAMIERAHADVELPSPELTWRAGLEAYAVARWDLMRAHPWLFEISTWRLPLGPHVMSLEEAGLRCLVDTGLTPAQVVDTLRVVDNAVAGLARSAAAEEVARTQQGTDYEAFWADTSDFWETRYDPSRFPTLTRLWSTGVYESAATPSELRLDGLLDSIALLVDHAQRHNPARIPTFAECMERYDERVEQVLHHRPDDEGGARG